MDTHQYRHPLRASISATAALLLVASAALGQEYEFANGDTGEVVETIGSAKIIAVGGLPLPGRRVIYTPRPESLLSSEWLMVQDELSGAVFAAPGGIVTGGDRMIGDFPLVATEPVLAVEVRSIVFDVWGEPFALLSATSIAVRHRDAREWALSPEWDDFQRAGTFQMSVSWVHRVMFEDESVLEADDEVIRAAWSAATELPFSRYADLEVMAVSGR